MNPADTMQHSLINADPSVGPLALPTHYALREQLQQTVVNDFLGPAGGPDEELDERPRDRYIVGMLAPRSRRSNIESFPAEEAGDIAVVSTANTRSEEHTSELQ